MILTEDGKLTRGKYTGRFVHELTDNELKMSVGGFNPSTNTTKADREFFAVELTGRKLSIPAGFIEGTAVPRGKVNGHSSKTAESGTSNGKNGSTNTNNGHAAAKAKTNGKPKPQSGRELYGDGNGEIEADTLYNSEEFHRRVSGGRGLMSADTLTDWIRDGLKAERGPDDRLWIRGSWYHEWIERGQRPEPKSESEPSSGSEKKIPSGRRGLLIHVVRKIIDLQEGMI